MLTKPVHPQSLDRDSAPSTTVQAIGTHFAAAERLDKEQLDEQLTKVCDHPLLGALLKTVGGLVAVLNEHRQILAINENLLGYLGVGSSDKLLGLRLGESLHCPHANEMPGGCGTSKFCSTCGAAIAQAVALHHNRSAERLCAIDAARGTKILPLFLRVRASPLELGGQQLILVFIEDVSTQQQNALAERAFRHDLNNTLTSLLCASESLAEAAAGEATGTSAAEVFHLTKQVVRELDLQRQLVSASVDHLRPIFTSTRLDTLFEELRRLIDHNPASRGRRTTITQPQPTVTIRTESTLLLRVLGNMALNALEATHPGGEIRIKTEVTPTAVVFQVWNEAPIPPEVARRIFQRNFSTKGILGRGMGTYSMKLIGEQLLGGVVGFSSSAMDGTTFHFSLPV